MAASSHYYGNLVVWDEKDDTWHYEDGELADKPRPCPFCGRLPTSEGYDGCLGYIPGAWSACCGHGVETGYVMIGEEP